MSVRSSATVTPIPYTIVEALAFSILSQSAALGLVFFSVSIGHVPWVVGFVAAASVVCALGSIILSWLKLRGSDPTPGSEEHTRVLDAVKVFFSGYLLSSYVLTEVTLYVVYGLIGLASINIAVPLLSIILTLFFPSIVLHLYVAILHGSDHILLEHLQTCGLVRIVPDVLTGLANKLGSVESRATLNAQDPDEVYSLPLYYQSDTTDSPFVDGQELHLGPTAVQTNGEGNY